MRQNVKVNGPDPIDVHAGVVLKEKRIERGMSQAAVAEGVGLTFQQVQKYERGANRMSASRLKQFAEVLKIDVSEFFDQTHEVEKLDRNTMEMIRLYTGLSERNRAVLRKIASALGDVEEVSPN